MPRGHGKPEDYVIGPEEWQLDALVVRQQRQWLWLGVLHPVVGCVLCVGWSSLVGIKHYNLEHNYLLGLNSK
jgi:hypothetical protein